MAPEAEILIPAHIRLHFSPFHRDALSADWCPRMQDVIQAYNDDLFLNGAPRAIGLGWGKQQRPVKGAGP